MLNLQQFITESHPSLSLAQPEHNDEILAFYNDTSMSQNHSSLHYDRSPHFFGYQTVQGQKVFTFISRLQHRIVSIGSLILQEYYIGGREVIVGYLCDLRSSTKSLKGKVYWRRFYEDLIQSASHIQELKDCRAFVTVIMSENQQAKKNLVTSSKLGLRYHYLDTLTMKTLSTFFSLPSSIDDKCIHSLASDNPRLEDFYRRQGQHKIIPSFSEFRYRFQQMKRIDPHAQIMAIKKQQNIEALCILWDQSTCKKIIFCEQNRFISMFSTLLSPFNIFPRNNSALSILYMTPIVGDHSYDLMLVAAALQLARTRGYHLLALPNPIYASPLALSIKTGIDLYQVCPGYQAPTLAKDFYFDFSLS